MRYWHSKSRTNPGTEVLNKVPYPNDYHFPAMVLVPLVYRLVLSCQSLHKITTVMMQGRTY